MKSQHRFRKGDLVTPRTEDFNLYGTCCIVIATWRLPLVSTVSVRPIHSGKYDVSWFLEKDVIPYTPPLTITQTRKVRNVT
jgi:hypothetical protein